MGDTKKVRHGFGVPNDPMPHQFLVRIPRGRTEPIEVWEDFGAAAVGTSGQTICRAEVPRTAWRKVADGVKTHLNRRLKEKGLKGSRFSTGENRIERLLGRELCVLAWAIEAASAEEAGIAFNRWSAHRPEELWWMFVQIDRDGGEWDDPATGWRMAIRHALIRADDADPQRKPRPSPRVEQATFDLFNAAKEDER